MIEGRMKRKATRGRKIMHMLSDLMENGSYTVRVRTGLRVGVVIDVLVTAEDYRATTN